ARHRRTHDERIELVVRDLESLLQLLELALDLRDLAHAQLLLLAIALGLQRLQLHEVIELILCGVTCFSRLELASSELLAARERALQTDDVVVDLRERFLVSDAVLFELRLVRLQLRDRLDEPALAVEHIELELRIGELDERLAGSDVVARLREHALDAAAFE